MAKWLTDQTGGDCYHPSVFFFQQLEKLGVLHAKASGGKRNLAPGSLKFHKKLPHLKVPRLQIKVSHEGSKVPDKGCTL